MASVSGYRAFLAAWPQTAAVRLVARIDLLQHQRFGQLLIAHVSPIRELTRKAIERRMQKRRSAATTDQDATDKVGEGARVSDFSFIAVTSVLTVCPTDPNHLFNRSRYCAQNGVGQEFCSEA
jgi:hypothetical protein